MDTHIKDNLNYLNDLRVKYAQRTTDTSAFSAETDVVTAPAFTPISSSRLIKITAFFRGWQASVATDIFAVRLKEGATQLQEKLIRSQSAGTGSDGNFIQVYVASPSAAAHTYKLTGVRLSGTGTMTLQADATYPCQIIVQDIGAA